MEMHQVRYFLAVAQLLNFTRAAEECNVTQPSLNTRDQAARGRARRRPVPPRTADGAN
jgi:DNA-binding transcriptional LysR family regulator